MSRRAASVARTRQRIVEAARDLHGEQGIAATSYDDIAARAGVGVGTVYRHFPSLDELIPACGALTMELVALPRPAEAAGLFEGAEDPSERIQRLVREAFGIYERGARWLRAIRREAGVHPGVAQSRREVEASLAALVDAALEPLDPSPRDRAIVRAMVDLHTWDALREQGLGQDEAVTAVASLLTGPGR